MERELAAFIGGRGDDLSLRIDLDRDSVIYETIPDDFTFVSPMPGLQVLFRQENRPGELLIRTIACQSSECDAEDDAVLFPLLLNHLLTAYLQRLKTENRAYICLLHACAAIRDGRAVLFSGASGVGKSTAAKLLMEAGSFALLGDDMVPLIRDESGWQAYASPFGGDAPRVEITNASAPVQAIYFLSQQHEPASHRLDVAQALALLMGSVVPANEIRNRTDQAIDEYDRESLGILLDDASLLAAEVPCFSLAYELDNPPWEQIFQAGKDREGV